MGVAATQRTIKAATIKVAERPSNPIRRNSKTKARGENSNGNN